MTIEIDGGYGGATVAETTASNTAASAQAEVDRIMGQIGSISAEIGSLAQAIATIQQAIAILQQQLGELQPPDSSEYWKEETYVDDEGNEQTRQVFDSAGFNAAMSEYLSEVSRIQSEIAAKESELRAKQNELDQKQSELERLQSELADAQAKVEEALQHDAEALRQAQEEHQRQMEMAREAQEQAQRLEAEAQRARDQLEEAQQQMDEIFAAAEEIGSVQEMVPGAESYTGDVDELSSIVSFTLSEAVQDQIEQLADNDELSRAQILEETQKQLQGFTDATNDAIANAQTALQTAADDLPQWRDVQPGDTLWDLVHSVGLIDAFGGDATEAINAVLAANPGITDPNMIISGERIVLPPLRDVSLSELARVAGFNTVPEAVAQGVNFDGEAFTEAVSDLTDPQVATMVAAWRESGRTEDEISAALTTLGISSEQVAQAELIQAGNYVQAGEAVDVANAAINQAAQSGQYGQLQSLTGDLAHAEAVQELVAQNNMSIEEAEAYLVQQAEVDRAQQQLDQVQVALDEAVDQGWSAEVPEYQHNVQQAEEVLRLVTDEEMTVADAQSYVVQQAEMGLAQVQLDQAQAALNEAPGQGRYSELPRLQGEVDDAREVLRLVTDEEMTVADAQAYLAQQTEVALAQNLVDDAQAMVDEINAQILDPRDHTAHQAELTAATENLRAAEAVQRLVIEDGLTLDAATEQVGYVPLVTGDVEGAEDERVTINLENVDPAIASYLQSAFNGEAYEELAGAQNIQLSINQTELAELQEITGQYMAANGYTEDSVGPQASVYQSIVNAEVPEDLSRAFDTFGTGWAGEALLGLYADNPIENGLPGEITVGEPETPVDAMSVIRDALPEWADVLDPGMRVDVGVQLPLGPNGAMVDARMFVQAVEVLEGDLENTVTLKVGIHAGAGVEVGGHDHATGLGGSLLLEGGHSWISDITVTEEAYAAMQSGELAIPNPYDLDTMPEGSRVMMFSDDYGRVKTEAEFRALMVSDDWSAYSGEVFGVTRVDEDTLQVFQGPHEAYQDYLMCGLSLGFHAGQLGHGHVALGLANRDWLRDYEGDMVQIDISSVDGQQAYNRFLANGELPDPSVDGVSTGAHIETLTYSSETGLAAEAQLHTSFGIHVDLGGELEIGVSEGITRVFTYPDGTRMVETHAVINGVGFHTVSDYEPGEEVPAHTHTEMLYNDIDPAQASYLYGAFTGTLNRELDGEQDVSLVLSDQDLEALQGLVTPLLEENEALASDVGPVGGLYNMIMEANDPVELAHSLMLYGRPGWQGEVLMGLYAEHWEDLPEGLPGSIRLGCDPHEPEHGHGPESDHGHEPESADAGHH